jgi:hypothetical protein
MHQLQLFVQSEEASISSLDSPLYLQTQVVGRIILGEDRYLDS